MNLNFTEKQYLLLLHFSVVTVSVLLGIFVLTDVRLNILGESHGAHLKAISIAISRLIYGVEGLAGLEQVLNILEEIPSISALNLGNEDSYLNYSALINDAIQKAIALENINANQLHGILNDQSYLYFVIFSFSLFGIKIQSLSCLWLLILLSSILIYLYSYRKNIPCLLVLWSFLIAIILIVMSNPGVGVQLISIFNYRFITILGLVPLLHIIFSNSNSKKCISDWGFITIQAMFLIFVMLMRGSAQWMLFGIFISVIYFIWKSRKALSSNAKSNENYFSNISIVSLFVPLAVIVFIFVIVSNMIPHFLNKEYDKEYWATTHGMWHPLVIGLTIDPVLYSKYVCTEKPLQDRLKGFRPILCEEASNQFIRPRAYYDIFSQPSDMHGFHAAVRYLREHGSEEQIGAEDNGTSYFNLNWKKYDEVLRKVYFQIILDDPLDSLYMYALMKPLKYIKEAIMYVKYFGNSILKSTNEIWMVSFLCFLSGCYCFLIYGYRKYQTKVEKVAEESLIIPSIYLFIIFISSLIPSIVFYSQSHTIPESVAALLALCLFMPFMYVQYLDKKL
jgi:hypothetical protein